MIPVVTDEQLALGWAIAWRTALATSLAAVALALTLRWFVGAPTPMIVIAAAVGGLLVGWRLPAARPLRRESWAREAVRYRA
jgi:hypothetical protein